MNEQTNILDEAEAQTTDSEQVLPIGGRLAHARAAASLTQEEVATRLCLRVSVIQSLEHDSFQELGGIVFARGYLRAYAKLLCLPADELIDAFNRMHSNAAPFVTPSLRQQPRQKRLVPWSSYGRRMLSLLFFGCCLVVVLVMVYRHNLVSRERIARTTISQLESPTNPMTKNSVTVSLPHAKTPVEDMLGMTLAQALSRQIPPPLSTVQQQQSIYAEAVVPKTSMRATPRQLSASPIVITNNPARLRSLSKHKSSS